MKIVDFDKFSKCRKNKKIVCIIASIFNVILQNISSSMIKFQRNVLIYSIASLKYIKYAHQTVRKYKK